MTLPRRSLLAASALLIPAPRARPASALTPAPKELQVIDRKIGFGDIAASGRTVVVHYTGWLYSPPRRTTRATNSTARMIAASRSASFWEPATSSPAGTRGWKA